MKTQWDGLRVCKKDYDKRHPQDAVRETSSGCDGSMAGGAGLDWNWGGGGYKPDLDPTTFIQEPNDDYFTDIPDGTFGDYVGDEVIWTPNSLEGLFIWYAGDKTGELYQDAALSSPITGSGQYIGGIDQTDYGLNDTLTQTSSSRQLRYFSTGQSLGGTPYVYAGETGSFPTGYGDLVGGDSYTGRVPIADYTIFIVMSNLEPTTVSGGGYFPLVHVGNSGKGLNLRYVGSTTNNQLWWWPGVAPVNTGLLVDYETTNDGLMVAARIGTLGEECKFIINLTDVATLTSASGDIIGNEFWIGSNDTSAGWLSNYHEVIMYDRQLTDEELTQVEDYLVEKHSLPFSR
jgi:hypothetical protein